MNRRGAGVRRAGVLVIAAAAVLGSAAGRAQEINDRPYVSPIRPGDLPASAGKDTAESPKGRNEWMKESLGGGVTPEFSARVIAEVERLRRLYPDRLAGAAPPAGVSSWRSLGPTDANRFQNGVNNANVDSGRLRVILPDPRPSKGDTVYVLTSGGGLWKTANFGATKPTWVSKTDAIFATAGGGAAFGRTPDVLYLGSGDPFDQGVGGVMYKSVNGGDTWSSPVILPGAVRILDVKVDTSQGSTTASDIVLVGTDVGLFRSTDGGATYSHVVLNVFPPFPEEVWSLVPTSAGWVASAAVYTVCSNCNEFTIPQVSTDHGATWSPIPDAGGVISFSGRTTLAVGAPGDSVVYAFAANNDGSDQLDLFRSVDGGLDWTATGMNAKTPTNPNIFNPDMDLMHGQAWYNQMLLVDPADSSRNTIYAGGNLSSAVSRDGGGTWTLLSSWVGPLPAHFTGGSPLLLPYVHADFHCAAISTASGAKRIFFGNDGGVFYTTDGGKSFIDDANQGLVTDLIYTLAVGTVHPENTLIGLQDNGTRFRVSGTTTYNGSIGGDGFGTAWSQANNGISMGSLYFLDIRRWTQNPPNEQNKYDVLLNTSNLAGPPPGFPWYNDSYFVTPIATPTAVADPAGRTFFTNTQHFLLKTADGGNSWSAIWTSPGARVIRSVSHGVGLAPDDLNFIGLAGTSGHVVLTSDGGATWTDVLVNATFGAWPASNSCVGWARNHSTLYLGSNSTLGGTHLAKSTDGGATWGPAASGLPGLPVLKLVVDPHDPAGNTVYAATWIGVFRTTDGGASWSLLGAGLPLAVISDMYLSPDGSFLRISSYGRGVWEISL